MPTKKNMLSEEMAPLEQNEKNLECEGVHYTIVKEEPKPHQINVSYLTRSPHPSSTDELNLAFAHRAEAHCRVG